MKGNKIQMDTGEQFPNSKIPDRFCNGKEQTLEDAINLGVEIKEELTKPGLERDDIIRMTFPRYKEGFTDFVFNARGSLDYINGKLFNKDGLSKLNEIVRIIPLSVRQLIARIEINYTPLDNIWMGVKMEDENKSKLEIGYRYLLTENKSNFKKLYTVIHELGHVIGYTKKGIYSKYEKEFESTRKECPNFSRMVTKYSCTDAGEEFAEHFAHWILDHDVEDEKPDVRFKYRFFEIYPELVKYKKEIRTLLSGSAFCK